jgi:hypothetical protein
VYHRLVARQKDVFDDKSMCDELLFGRSGYLYALLFVEHHLGANTVDAKLISSVRRTDGLLAYLLNEG